jgi:hypothetical protein
MRKSEQSNTQVRIRAAADIPGIYRISRRPPRHGRSSNASWLRRKPAKPQITQAAFLPGSHVDGAAIRLFDLHALRFAGESPSILELLHYFATA